MGEQNIRLPNEGALTGKYVRTLEHVVSAVTIQVHFFADQGLNLEVASSTASANVTYVGEALPGVVSTTSGWRIKKIDESTGFAVIRWSNGTDAFTTNFSSRQSVSYS